MTTYFVNRHPGASQWAHEEGIAVDHQVGHFEPEWVEAGDRLLGTLPIHLAAEVCRRGGRYFHLEMTVPPEWRGRELSAEDMRRCGARLQEYWVTALPETGHS
jgi:CRISPR-associated protein Csx16